MTTISESPRRLFDHPILPIAIRDDVVVRIGGLPGDLTRAEAGRIVPILRAHVLDRSEDLCVAIDACEPTQPNGSQSNGAEP